MKTSFGPDSNVIIDSEGKSVNLSDAELHSLGLQIAKLTHADFDDAVDWLLNESPVASDPDAICRFWGIVDGLVTREDAQHTNPETIDELRAARENGEQ